MGNRRRLLRPFHQIAPGGYNGAENLIADQALEMRLGDGDGAAQG